MSRCICLVTLDPIAVLSQNTVIKSSGNDLKTITKAYLFEEWN